MGIIGGVTEVAHHAIGAVGSVTHNLLGDEKDFIFNVAHHIIGGVAGVAHHAIGAVGSVTHNLLGDEEINEMTNKLMDQLVEDVVEINDNNRDFVFSLAHHIIGGVTEVAHHAIGAVGSVTHNLLGDEKDFQA